MLFHFVILQNGLPVLPLEKTYFKLQRCGALSKMIGFKVATESLIKSFKSLAQSGDAGPACQQF